MSPYRSYKCGEGNVRTVVQSACVFGLLRHARTVVVWEGRDCCPSTAAYTSTMLSCVEWRDFGRRDFVCDALCEVMNDLF